MSSTGEAAPQIVLTSPSQRLSDIVDIIKLTPLAEISLNEKFFPTKIERSMAKVIKKHAMKCNQTNLSFLTYILHKPEHQFIQSQKKKQTLLRVKCYQFKKQSLQQKLVFELPDEINCEVGNTYKLALIGFEAEEESSMQKRRDAQQTSALEAKLLSMEKYKKITHIVIQKCSNDVVHMINNLCKKTEQIADSISLKIFECSYSVVNIYAVKKLFSTHRDTILNIDLKDVRIHKENTLNDVQSTSRIMRFLNRQSILTRENAIRSLLLQEFFKPPVFPQIQSLTITLLPLISLEDEKPEDRAWELTRYKNALQELEEELQVHVHMRSNLQCLFGYVRADPTHQPPIQLLDDLIEIYYRNPVGYTVDENSFNSQKGLQYTLDILQYHEDWIEEVTFINLFKPNLSIFKLIMARLRNLNLKSIVFVNVPLPFEHLEIIKNLFWWLKNVLTRIVFGSNGMYASEFSYLFNSDNLNIQDFTALTALHVFDNDDVLCSTVYRSMIGHVSKRLEKFEQSRIKKRNSIRKPDTAGMSRAQKYRHRYSSRFSSHEVHMLKKKNHKATLPLPRDSFQVDELNLKKLPNIDQKENGNNSSDKNSPPINPVQHDNQQIEASNELKGSESGAQGEQEQNRNDEIIQNEPIDQKEKAIKIEDLRLDDIESGGLKGLQGLTLKKQKESMKQESEPIEIEMIGKSGDDIAEKPQDILNNKGRRSLQRGKRSFIDDKSESSNKQMNQIGIHNGFQDVDKLRTSVQTFCQIECNSMFRAENEDSLTSILKYHFIQKDYNKTLDLSRVDLSKCSLHTQKYLIEYISSSKRLENVILVLSTKEFALNLSSKIHSSKKVFESFDVTLPPPKKVNSVEQDQYNNLCEQIMNSSRHVILRGLTLTNGSFSQILSSLITKPICIEIENLIVDEKLVALKTISEWFTCFWSTGMPELIWKSVSSSPWLSTALDESLCSPQASTRISQMNYHKIILDGNLISAKSLDVLLSQNFKTLQELRITNLNSFDSLEFFDPYKSKRLVTTAPSTFKSKWQSQNADEIFSGALSLINRRDITQQIECRYITILDLSGTQQTGLVDFISFILQRTDRLKELYLRGSLSNGFSIITANEAEQLSKLFTSPTNNRHQLEVLDLSYNCEIEDKRRTSKQGSSLAQLLDAIFIYSSLTLKALYLQGREEQESNLIWESNLKGLTRMFSSSLIQLPALEILDLSQNVMRSDLGQEGFMGLIASILTNSPNVHDLRLRGKPSQSMIDDAAGEYLTRFFNSNTSLQLKHIDISQNLSVSTQNFSELMSAIILSCQSIRSIKLAGSTSHVMLTNEKAKALIDVLEDNVEYLQEIREIDLSKNVALSARVLGQLLNSILKNCKKISILRLRGYDSFSMIENEKAKALAQALQHLSSRQKTPDSSENNNKDNNNNNNSGGAFEILDVSLNNIDAGPLNTLFKSLLENTSIKAQRINQQRTTRHSLAKKESLVLPLLNSEIQMLPQVEEEIESNHSVDENCTLTFDGLMGIHGGRLLPDLQEVVLTEIALINPNVLENFTRTVLSGSFKSIRKLGLLGSPSMQVLDDERVEMLSEIFDEFYSYLNCLEEVDISMNSINEDPLHLFLESIFQCKSLKKLRICGSVQYSMINNTRAKALIEFFDCHRNLALIDLSYNLIDNREVIHNLLKNIIVYNADSLSNLDLFYPSANVSTIYADTITRILEKLDVYLTEVNTILTEADKVIAASPVAQRPPLHLLVSQNSFTTASALAAKAKRKSHLGGLHSPLSPLLLKQQSSANFNTAPVFSLDHNAPKAKQTQFFPEKKIINLFKATSTYSTTTPQQTNDLDFNSFKGARSIEDSLKSPQTNKSPENSEESETESDPESKPALNLVSTVLSGGLPQNADSLIHAENTVSNPNNNNNSSNQTNQSSMDVQQQAQQPSKVVSEVLPLLLASPSTTTDKLNDTIGFEQQQQQQLKQNEEKNNEEKNKESNESNNNNGFKNFFSTLGKVIEATKTKALKQIGVTKKVIPTIILLPSFESVCLFRTGCRSRTFRALQKAIDGISKVDSKIIFEYNLASAATYDESDKETVLFDKSVVSTLDLSGSIDRLNEMLQMKRKMIVRREALEEKPLLAYCFSFCKPLKQFKFETLLAQKNVRTLMMSELFLRTCRFLLPIKPNGLNLHSMILNNELFSIMQNVKASQLERIVFPSSNINPGFECIKDDVFVTFVQKHCEGIHTLKSIQLEYEFSQDDPSYTNLNDLELIQKLLLMPPAILKTKPTSNLNFLKALYTILYDSTYFESCQIFSNETSAINSGIAASLIEKIYKMNPNKRTSNFVYQLKKILYFIFFAISTNETIYRLDPQIIKLNQDIVSKRFLKIGFRELLVIMNVLQMFAQVSPLIYSDLNDSSAKVSPTAYYIFAAFGVVSFIIEFFLFRDLLNYISHLISEVHITQSKKTLSRIMNFFKKFIMDFQYFNITAFKSIISLLQSLVARYHTFSDVSFIIVCLQTNYTEYAYISSGILIFHLLINYFGFLRYLLRKRKVKRVLNTDNIIQYYKIAALTECSALSDQLDAICPYNVNHLPDWGILKSWRNQSINNRIMNYVYKFVFQNSPQIVLQTFYLVKSNGETFNYTVIFSMITSVLSFLISFLKFLTIRPSVITQIDFNELAAKKQIEMYSNYKLQEHSSNSQFRAAFPAYYSNYLNPTANQVANTVAKSKDTKDKAAIIMNQRNQARPSAIEFEKKKPDLRNNLPFAPNNNNDETFNGSIHPLNITKHIQTKLHLGEFDS